MSATRMRPFHLDTIANNFPRLKLIGAHLGGTGNYDEAASVARWRHNVYFDFSGGTTIERHAVERRLIGHEIGYEKLIFGSDCAPEKIARSHPALGHDLRSARCARGLPRADVVGERRRAYGLEEPKWIGSK